MLSYLLADVLRSADVVVFVGIVSRDEAHDPAIKDKKVHNMKHSISDFRLFEPHRNQHGCSDIKIQLS